MHKYTHVFFRHEDQVFKMKMEMVPHAENPSRVNHIIVKGDWKNLQHQCWFDYYKMMRFKHMFEFYDHTSADTGPFPLFHVC